MAKKRGRSRRKGGRTRLSATQLMQPGAQEITAVGAADAASEPTDLREEYSYVLGDIRRALALAAVVLMAVVASVLLLW